MTVYYMTDALYDSQPKSKVTAFKTVSLLSSSKMYLASGVIAQQRKHSVY
jgi:hypothetical protein